MRRVQAPIRECDALGINRLSPGLCPCRAQREPVPALQRQQARRRGNHGQPEVEHAIRGDGQDGRSEPDADPHQREGKQSLDGAGAREGKRPARERVAARVPDDQRRDRRMPREA